MLHKVTVETDWQGFTRANVDFVLNGREYGLGISPTGTPARQVYQGPLVDELFGWLNERPTVIGTWHPDPLPRVEIKEGDIISVEGHGSFRVRTSRWDGVKLDLVES